MVVTHWSSIIWPRHYKTCSPYHKSFIDLAFSVNMANIDLAFWPFLKSTWVINLKTLIKSRLYLNIADTLID